MALYGEILGGKMRPLTSQQETALYGLHIVAGIAFGLLTVIFLLCGPEFLAWLLR
jgi:hypothetical protein